MLKNILKQRIYIDKRTYVKNEGCIWERFLECYFSFEWHKAWDCLMGWRDAEAGKDMKKLLDKDRESSLLYSYSFNKFFFADFRAYANLFLSLTVATRHLSNLDCGGDGEILIVRK
ncbi:MAG: hypothetical protein PHZ02_06640 [Desulfocapsaceae bacterium]|nr:hypothetical protein [Desulfocapsaceae bacterium]